jgi:hypothetical protein
MDSEHRHELKTNELADWINHFPEFCKKNLSNIVGAVLIVAAIVSYFGFKAQKTSANTDQQVRTTATIQKLDQEKLQTFGSSMSGNSETINTLITTAGTLQTEAEKAKQPQHAALAYIKQAEALRSDLHYTTDIVDDELITAQIGLAKQAYEKALENAQGNPTLTATAQYGLGLCAEEVGDFVKATEIYYTIVNDENFAGTFFPKQAQYRLDIMGDHLEKFDFVAAPEIVIPEGFDESAAEALKDGGIFIEPEPKEENKDGSK